MSYRNVTLSGSVDMFALTPILTLAESQARRGQAGACLELDCSGVDDFTSLGLALLARSRRVLLGLGSDLCLVGCGERIRARMVHPLFEALCR